MNPEHFVLLAGLSVLAYLPFTHIETPSLWRSALKTLTLLILIVGAIWLGAPWHVVLAFAASAMGDLALSREGDRAFLIGLVSFALAHVFFVIALGSPIAGLQAAPIPVLVLLLLGASTERWLAPHTGDLRWPVRAYVVIILLMAAAALGTGAPFLITGAALFILSDLILAIRLFRLQPGSTARLADRSLWVCYTWGQILLFLGFVLPA